MSEYCGDLCVHTKMRGKIHICEWCGSKIEVGDKYAKWLQIVDLRRSTIYAHHECWRAWEALAQSTDEVVYGERCDPRPVVDNSSPAALYPPELRDTTTAAERVKELTQ